MNPEARPEARTATIAILGQTYRIRSDADPAHLEQVAGYVNRLLSDLRQSTADTQDAAVLATLNVASDLLRLREAQSLVSDERIQALIELVDSV
jgi:cell division protein ZapA (FtsZ GTPase activity inhibitor)